jgi:hypothetical protein
MTKKKQNNDDLYYLYSTELESEDDVSVEIARLSYERTLLVKDHHEFFSVLINQAIENFSKVLKTELPAKELGNAASRVRNVSFIINDMRDNGIRPENSLFKIVSDEVDAAAKIAFGVIHSNDRSDLVHAISYLYLALSNLVLWVKNLKELESVKNVA